MIPALAVIGIGRRRRFPIPVPLFLLWPLVAIAFGIVLLIGLFISPKTEAGRALRVARAGLTTLFHLSGLQIDVRSRSGENVRFRLV